MRAKTAIIGGGLMGTSIAWHLAQRVDSLRDTVVLFEKGEIGAGASGRASAVLSQVHQDLGLAGMARDSLKLYAAFEGVSGRPIGFQASGVLTLAASQSEADRAQFIALAQELISIGIQVRLLEDDELREVVPDIQVEPGTIGLYEERGGFLDPARTMASIGALARNQGAVLRTATEVDEILFDGDRVVGLRTSRGEIETERVVVAAGPWTTTMLARAGVDLPLRLLRTHQHHMQRPRLGGADGTGDRTAEQEDLSQTWIRGFDEQHVRAETQESDLEERYTGENEERARHPVIVDREHGILVRCEPAQERTRVLEIGERHAEDIVDPEIESGTSPSTFGAWAQQVLARRMPCYRGVESAGSETSWENHTPDGLPLVGEVAGTQGLWVVAGFGQRGYEFAPSIGEGMAQLLTGKPVSAFDPERLSPARFHVTRVASRGQGMAGGTV